MPNCLNIHDILKSNNYVYHDCFLVHKIVVIVELLPDEDIQEMFHMGYQDLDFWFDGEKKKEREK